MQPTSGRCRHSATGISILCQGYSDPQLASAKAGILVLMLPIALGFMVAGLLLRQRNEAVAGLRARNEELRKQRERMRSSRWRPTVPA